MKNYWIRKKINRLTMLAIVVALVALLVMPLATMADNGVAPSRDLPPEAARGTQFEVTVTFSAPEDNFNAPLLTDFAPIGWQVEADKDWCTPVAVGALAIDNKAEILWAGPYTSGTELTAMYKVTVPDDAALGTHTFLDGTLEYYLAGEGPYSENIVGDNEIEVTSTPVVPIRDLPPSAARGEQFDVTVTFTTPQDDFNALLLTDFAPDGWQVEADKDWCTPAALAAMADDNKAEILWAGPYLSGTEFTAKYKVTVPGDAALGTHTFPDGTLEYYITEDGPYSVAIVGDDEIEVLSTNLNVDFSATPTTGLAPSRVTFTDETTGGQTPYRWEWNFGDGKTSTAENPTHIYVGVGRFTVILTVTDSDGNAGNESGTVLVLPQQGAGEPIYSPSSLNILPEQVEPDQQVDVSINIANVGEADGTYQAVLYINTVLKDSQTVGIPAGSTQSVVFHITESEPGTYQVSLGGLEGQFTVIELDDDTDYLAGGLGTGGIIAIVVIVIVLIVAILFVFRKRE